MRNTINNFKKMAVWTRQNVIFLLSLAVIITTAIVAYWRLFPYDPLSVKEVVILNENKTVNPGGVLIADVTYCKYNNASEVINRKLVGKGYEIPLPPKDQLTYAPVGCGTVRVNTVIPELDVSGVNVIRFEVDYKVNPVREVHETFDIGEFIIEK